MIAMTVDPLRALHPTLDIRSGVSFLDPCDVLIGEATERDLLVLGAPESESPWSVRPKNILHRSVARTAARRGPCPVVVVHPSRPGPIRRIVVGVDGSSPAKAALAWACNEAVLHGAELQLVHVWSRTCSTTGPEILDRALDECRARTSTAVTGELIEGPAAPILAEASADADLVAIGSRGQSGFRTALFGSVALALAETARCPVAVTHPGPPRQP